MRSGTEAEYQATIVHAARLAGWLVHHTRPALTRSGRWSTPISGYPGFPDLVLARADRGVLFVELKRRSNGLTVEQREWRDALQAAGADWRLVYVPEGVDALLAELCERSAA